MIHFLDALPRFSRALSSVGKVRIRLRLRYICFIR